MEGRIEGPDTNANTNTTHEYGDFDWRFFKMEGGSEGGIIFRRRCGYQPGDRYRGVKRLKVRLAAV